MGFGEVLKKLRPGDAGPEVVDGEEIATRKSEVDVLYEAIDAHFADQRFREDGKFHVSSMYDLCPKREWFKVYSPLMAYKVGKMLGVVFDVGHAVHHMLQTYLAGRLIGDWTCTNKVCTAGRVKHEMCYRPSECPACHEKEFKFSEPTRENLELNLVGSCDGAIEIWGKRYVLEIKSMKHELFVELKAPKIEHEWQGEGYMFLFGEERVLIVYVDKLPLIAGEINMKAFAIERNEERQTQIAEFSSAANEAVRNGEFPTIGLCDVRKDGKCRWKKKCEKKCLDAAAYG